MRGLVLHGKKRKEQRTLHVHVFSSMKRSFILQKLELIYETEQFQLSAPISALMASNNSSCICHCKRKWCKIIFLKAPSFESLHISEEHNDEQEGQKKKKKMTG